MSSKYKKEEEKETITEKNFKHIIAENLQIYIKI